jgi:excisionase family DNA binding protein
MGLMGLRKELPSECQTLTVREAAGALRVDQQQVRGWIKQGLIEVMCLGPRQTRIPATALARFIKQQTMRLTTFGLEAAA